MTRVVAVSPEPTPYRAPLFDRIAAHDDVDLTVVYAARTVARSVTAPPSDHAYGAAIDIDAPTNGYGATPTMDPRVVKVFEHWGFNWGGDFLIPDGMHFEYGGPPPAPKLGSRPSPRV